jgi:hypothetical protein
LTSWITGASAKDQVTDTYYDTPLNSTVNGYFGSAGEQNLRNRVASVTITDAGSGSYDHATHYSYDVHGNVSTLIQEDPHLLNIGQNLKYINYEYDLISGKVNQVDYQNQLDGSSHPMFDRFYHKYLYDADNRLTQIFTSRDSIIWEKEAKYFYYNHDPLARTEIGDKEVQGTDYVYSMSMIANMSINLMLYNPFRAVVL